MADTDYWEALNKVSKLNAGADSDLAYLIDIYSDKLNSDQLASIHDVYQRSCNLKNKNGLNKTE
ncbi:MAG: hypothetical protein MJK15_18595 [Colwellia sp.]|nr:hypothetical protein [Colwellia sp.]